MSEADDDLPLPLRSTVGIVLVSGSRSRQRAFRRCFVDHLSAPFAGGHHPHPLCHRGMGHECCGTGGESAPPLLPAAVQPSRRQPSTELCRPPQMTFYPLEFVGFCKPFLGWQGIIPSKAKVRRPITRAAAVPAPSQPRTARSLRRR